MQRYFYNLGNNGWQFGNRRSMGLVFGFMWRYVCDSGASPVLSPTVTTTYYVLASGTCNTTACSNTTVTVNYLSSTATGATSVFTQFVRAHQQHLGITGGSLVQGSMGLVHRFMCRNICNIRCFTGIKSRQSQQHIMY